jgi:hypothetical protein
MDEVFKYQESVTDDLLAANDKFRQIDQTHDIDGVLTQAKDYHEKIINMKKSLTILKDRSSKLRKRAVKVLEEKKREDIEKQRLKERQELLEKHLEPVVNTSLE